MQTYIRVEINSNQKKILILIHMKHLKIKQSFWVEIKA